MPTSDSLNALEWRSWQPDNLLDDGRTQPEPPSTLNPAATDAQFQAELARLRKQAEQQGHSQGLAQGREEGQKQGYDAGFQSGHEAGLAQGISEAQGDRQAAMKEVESWIASFRESLDNLDSLIPSRLVQLALQAVKDLYGPLQPCNGTQLLEQIRTLMQRDTLLHGTIYLQVNPNERELIESSLGDTLAAIGWQIQSDAQLSAGGCRIVTEEMELDATLETRWQTLCHLAREGLSA